MNIVESRRRKVKLEDNELLCRVGSCPPLRTLHETCFYYEFQPKRTVNEVQITAHLLKTAKLISIGFAFSLSFLLLRLGEAL
jgi:hypothetical protein